MPKTITLTTTNEKLNEFTLLIGVEQTDRFCEMVGLSWAEVYELRKDSAPLESQVTNFMRLADLTVPQLRELLEDLPQSLPSAASGQSEA